MDFSHVAVNPLATRERLHTLPADMCLTSCAHHVVAPLRLLNWHTASWALLHVVLLYPLLKQLILDLIRTLESVMTLRMAPCADAREASRTL